MGQAGLAKNEYEIPFEAFGVRVALGTNRPELIERLRAVLPPHWRPCPASAVKNRFVLIAHEAGTYELTANEQTLDQGLELELALTILDAQLRMHVGIEAHDSTFIHAGVVAYGGRTMILPGRSFAGKTMLVAALVRAGATYYSDEFAVIDERGLVHPYAKPPSVRAGDDGRQTDHPLESLGWAAGSEPLPAGAIVVTSYRPGAEWRPRRLTAGEGAMALLANTVPARERPAQVMRTLSRAAADAVAIESERGEADEVVPLLLAEL